MARQGVRLFQLELPPVGARYAALQIGLSTLDWALAVAVLYALLPSGKIGFWAFLGAFVSAQLVALASHVPGGLGIFESALVLLCKPNLDVGTLVPALVLFRFVYYLLPLAAALIILVVDEAWARRHQLRRAGAVFGALSKEISPRLLAVLCFLAGAVLLFSGATPAASGRLAVVADLVPLRLVEVSHFLSSLAGVGLLVLSRGIARRLDASYYLVLVALGTGIVTSLLKGGDFEEALILAVLLAIFVPSRLHFDRRAAFFSGAFSPGWVAAVAAAAVSAVWLGLFAFKHVEYSHDLWWQFELEAEAPRFLRASVGSALALLVLALGRLMRPAAPELPVATDEELRLAGDAIARQELTQPFLVYLRDKALLFDEAREAFVMYGVQGRTWIALGDPVGSEGSAAELVRAFLERVDDYGGTPVFYQVSPRRLSIYADFGLVLAKLGEQAKVDLAGFGIEGSAGKPFRNILSRMQKEGASFRMLPPEGVTAVLPELRLVSDQWLETLSAAEKGFSLGYFDEDYLRRFPVAVVERGGRVEAFANVWPGPGRRELSVDLMRYRPDAPKNVMEALFVHMMLWGKGEGFQRFDLGMAPLSGLETSDVASLWNRIASAFYETGRAPLQFPGASGLQREVSSRLGTQVPRLPWGSLHGPRSGRCFRAHRGRLPQDICPMKRSRMICTLLCGLLLPTAPALVALAKDVDTFAFGAAGTVHVYAPSAAPASVALFISGDGGWNQGVVDMAERLRRLGALVVGIDIRTFYRNLAASTAKCAYPAGDLEELSRNVQMRYKLPKYQPPVLVGYSSGAHPRLCSRSPRPRPRPSPVRSASASVPTSKSASHCAPGGGSPRLAGRGHRQG